MKRARLLCRSIAATLTLSVLACGEQPQGEAAAPGNAAGQTAPTGGGGSAAGASALPVSQAAPERMDAGGAGRAAIGGAGSASVAGAGAAARAAAADSGDAPAGDAGAAGAAGAATAGAAGQAASPRLPPVTSTSEAGPFSPKQDLNAGPQGQSGVFWPDPLGQDDILHPVFIWGCGGSSTPSQYADQLSQIASHGFIVVAEIVEIGDDGAPLTAAIDWITAENERADSMFHRRVDVSKIALGGHSIGSANSFFVADDPRLTTTIHVAGGSLDDVNDPFAATTGMGGKRLVHPVAYICSMSDTFGNVEKTEKDYDNTTVPAWMTVMTGVDHVAAARSGLPATIAWLRWHLAGENERRSAFLDESGEFMTGIFVSRSKNW